MHFMHAQMVTNGVTDRKLKFRREGEHIDLVMHMKKIIIDLVICRG